MPKADRVHSTPRRTAPAARAIDAYSMSPAIRLRYRILAQKTFARALLPPPVGEEAHGYYSDADAVADAFRDNHALARLIRLRAEAAERVEQLLTFLDETEGVVDDEECGDEQDGDLAGSASDCEYDQSDAEPSLGWAEDVAQLGARWGNTADLEIM